MLRLPTKPEPSQLQRTQQKTHGARVQGTIPRARKTVYNCHVVICRRLHAHPQTEHRVDNRKITSNAQYSQVQGRSHSQKAERRESHSQHLIIPINGRLHTRTETQGHYHNRHSRYLRGQSPTSRTVALSINPNCTTFGQDIVILSSDSQDSFHTASVNSATTRNAQHSEPMDWTLTH